MFIVYSLGHYNSMEQLKRVYLQFYYANIVPTYAGTFKNC